MLLVFLSFTSGASLLCNTGLKNNLCFFQAVLYCVVRRSYRYFKWGKKTGAFGYVKARWIKSRKEWKIWRLWPGAADVLSRTYKTPDEIAKLRPIKSRPSPVAIRDSAASMSPVARSTMTTFEMGAWLKDNAEDHRRRRRYRRDREDAPGPTEIGLVPDDGGRADAGYTGSAGDCVTRAIAIAEDRDYDEVRADLMEATKTWRAKSRSRAAKRSKSNSVRNGTRATVYRPYLESRGWTRTPLMKFGSPERKHMLPDDVPSGRVIVEMPRHVAAIIDHKLHDTHDCRKTNVWVNGSPTEAKKPRMITGVWTKE